ncbi:hypothetical protein BCV69DRAFT_311163, partial [Microstroma glucosiphilum]
MSVLPSLRSRTFSGSSDATTRRRQDPSWPCPGDTLSSVLPRAESMKCTDEEDAQETDDSLPRLSIASYDSTVGPYTSARTSFASTVASGPSPEGHSVAFLSPFQEGSLSVEPSTRHSDVIIRTSSSLTIRPQRPTRRSHSAESQQSSTPTHRNVSREDRQRASSSSGVVRYPVTDDWGKQFWVVIIDPG